MKQLIHCELLKQDFCFVKGKQKSWFWGYVPNYSGYVSNYIHEYHTDGFLIMCFQSGIFWLSLHLTGC